MALVNQASSQLLLGAGATERMMRLAAGRPTRIERRGPQKARTTDGGVAQRDHALRRAFHQGPGRQRQGVQRLAARSTGGCPRRTSSGASRTPGCSGGRASSPRTTPARSWTGWRGSTPSLHERGGLPDGRRRRGHPQLRRARGWAQLVGPAAGRLHTARSRNDQVANDLRMWSRAAVCDGIGAALALQAALLDRAERDKGLILPGLYPPPARPAGPAQPPLAGVRRDAGPRRRPARRPAASGWT